MIATLPMYDWPELRPATDSFWSILAKELNLAGFDAPPNLIRDGALDPHWLSDDLLFSQTCGYPFTTRLKGQVQLLATPCYAVEGCTGANYSSAVLVHRNSSASGIEDVLKGKFAFNGRDSLSGFRCLIPLIGYPDEQFSQSIESGSHRQSALMVAEGEADCAAIDAVCWDLISRFEPAALDELRVLLWAPQFPALPFITNKLFVDDQVSRLRTALVTAVEKAANDASACQLKIERCEFPELSRYSAISSLT